MRKLIALAALAIMVVAASCETMNIGGGSPIFFSITGVTTAGTLNVGQVVTITATVAGADGAYNVNWNFGGGATPNTVTVNGEAGGSTSVTATLSAEGTFTGTVTATDADNATMIAGPFNFTYTVGPALNAQPTGSATLAGNVITVTANDTDTVDDPNLTIDVKTVPAGLSVTPNTANVANGGSADFTVTATDALAGGTGTVVFTVDDQNGAPNSVSTDISQAVTIAPLVPPADTLLATPLSGSAATGADVTVLIVTGVPANPFQYMVGCGLTIESDAAYTAASFDVGAVDGTPDVGTVNPVDGIWGEMNGGAGPTGGFLLAPDNFIQATDIGGGRERWDFNITPLGGSNLTGENGALFNAKFSFTGAGTKTFGFQDVSGVKRTYYADDATEYFWGNIANDGSVVPNSVTIN